MIAELLFVFLIPLVWGFFELRQLRQPAATVPKPSPPQPPPSPDLAPGEETRLAAAETNHPPSKHQQEQEE
jgi:hypothetical protein